MSSPSSVRRCSRCRIEKPLDQFYRDRSKAQGVGSRCRVCCQETYMRPAAAAAASQRYRERHPERVMRTKLKNRLKQHSMTLEEYDAIVASQHGLCATCFEPLAGGAQQHLDHCHSTGAVRGVLCNLCNLALGYARDDPETLLEMADYIRRHRARSTGQ